MRKGAAIEVSYFSCERTYQLAQLSLAWSTGIPEPLRKASDSVAKEKINHPSGLCLARNIARLVWE